MATVLPKADDRGMDMQDTRISSEPLDELPMPPSRRPYGPGDLIDGKYELEALLGRGGMGEVWTAKNETLGVRRAVKLIRADAGNAESTDRLLHEAQTAAKLAEPAIVRVFDFGKTGWGDPYIVMELLEGEDLMSIISRRERLSPTQAVRLLLPLIRGLGTAHAHGIVHRDLKPENIFLAKLPDGRVQPKLLDFGIAKLKNARSLRLTSAGAVMGSPLYMAPEQARGEDVDERADVWALCVVLYESITGSSPFRGDNRAQVLRAVADHTPEPLSHYEINDTSLWPILSRGLEKQPDDRWPSMDELGRALARWLLDTGINDDITGASIEAAWFRRSRQSLFGSSLPPDRRFGKAQRAFRALISRARQGCSRLQAVGNRSWRALRDLDRSRRWLLSGLVAAGLVIVLVFGTRDELAEPPAQAGPEPGASAHTPEPPTPEGPAPMTLESHAAELEANATSLPPLADARSDPEPSRLPKKSQRAADAARRETKEQRRSKLIDPYQ
jgi:eukaryotic-like serine/threonine-protein kinase